MSKRWYAVQAFSGYEKIVQKGLLERIAQSEISDQFGEILVPVEEVVEMKSGQKKVTERRLYPGYVLVQMEMNDDSWHLVKSNPKVTAFIGGSGTKPAPITNNEVDIILQRMDEHDSQKLSLEGKNSHRRASLRRRLRFAFCSQLCGIGVSGPAAAKAARNRRGQAWRNRVARAPAARRTLGPRCLT